MTVVKICGNREPADVLAAAGAGADMIGLVFVPGRSRRLDVDKARQVMAALRAQHPSPSMAVGLFADQPIDEVNHALRSCGLDMAQLCGGESVEYCGQVEVPVIKVVHVDASLKVEEAVPKLADELATLTALGYRVTLDRRVEGLQGGTGQAFEWEVAHQLADMGYDFLLAGGLSPDNVAEAVRTAHPWGVDVSSGVETGGRKDPAKVQSFVQRVREADKLLATSRGTH